jgi:TolA-binding protein
MIFGGRERIRSLELRVGELEGQKALLQDQLASAQAQHAKSLQSSDSGGKTDCRAAAPVLLPSVRIGQSLSESRAEPRSAG